MRPEYDHEHLLIAVEQYVYWRRQGLTPRQMLASVGMRPPYGRPITTELVVDVLAAVHRDLTRGAA